MTAIWILLGLAVLSGGGILAFVVYAVRHDDSADGATAGTEVSRFSQESGAAPKPEAVGLRAGRRAEGEQ